MTPVGLCTHFLMEETIVNLGKKVFSTNGKVKKKELSPPKFI